ncbi:MAG: hypothetical protein RIM84_21670 [Alphaproteobacteria bacterium]
MIGRFVLILLAFLVASGPCAADEPKAPPMVPSSYELRRVEAQIRQVLATQAAEAKRKSRQIEVTGTGAAAGADPDSDFSFDITAKEAGGLALTTVIGIAAFTALSEDTSPTVSGGPSPGAGATATTTGTQ